MGNIFVPKNIGRVFYEKKLLSLISSVVILSVSAVPMTSFAEVSQKAAIPKASSDFKQTTTAIKNEEVVSKVSPYVETEPNGTVKVIKKDLINIGLTDEQVQMVKKQINEYNQLITDGKVDPTTHMLKSSTSSSEVQTMSTTNGIPSSWFTSSPADMKEFHYWWGYEDTYNELGTQHLEGALNMIAGGAGAAAAAPLWVPFLGEGAVGILGTFSGVTWATAGYLQYRDNGYGDTVVYALAVPDYAYGNSIN
ncbi:hypothetical protein [Paenibacillus sp. 1-18]|uniref:hypothetical protein n=1 Tax=Paenibacillus sp. 1-18 TaxID=1333846 RepID=UPI0004B216C1|nr:hypothetical protein [Paenibacillus sp. 1-18]